MFDANIIKLLSVRLQKPGKTSDSYPIRLANIKWVLTLYTENLKYNEREKQILIKSFDSSRELYLQIPGKESIREGDKSRPYDFFPVLLYRNTNAYHRDLAFTELWQILEEILNSIKPEDKYVVHLFAVLLYRMAFMVDHKLQTKPERVKIRYLEHAPAGIAINECEEILPARYYYDPPKPIINLVSDKIKSIFDMDFEVFLHYLELLSWNEDCKYYYKDQLKKKKGWINEVGRVNNIMTMISYLGIDLKAIKLSKIFSGFARHGVSNINEEDILALGAGLILPNEKKP